MKVGDLVTLSQYGQNLGSIPYRFKTYSGRKERLIGLVTEVRNVGEMARYLSENECVQYRVRWVAEGPPGRDYFASYFYRNDLKFIR